MANRDVMDYITILTAGNATDFGNLTTAQYGGKTACSIVRGIIFGGHGAPGAIDYITIASVGNATDFGDHVNTAAVDYNWCVHNKIYAYFARILDANQEKHTIATAANATAFLWTSLGNTGTNALQTPIKGWIAASG